MAGPAYIWGPWRFEPTECRLLRDNTLVPMPGKTLDLLATLLRRTPRLVTKEEILNAVWPNATVEEGNIAFHVAALRKVLDADEGPSAIETVRGRGYRFVHDVAILQMPPTDEVQQRIVERPPVMPQQREPVAPLPPQPQPVVPPQPQRRAPWRAWTAAGLIVAAIVVTAVMRWPSEEWSVVVMPFEVVDSVEGEALIPGLAEYIALQLQRAEVLAQASTGGPMGERPRDAGTRLGADAVLTGTLRPLPGGWQVSVELTRTSDGSREWTWVFEVGNDTERPTGAGPDDARSRIQGIIGGRIASGLAGRLADRID